MSPRRALVWTAFLGLHLFFVISAALLDMSSALAGAGGAILPWSLPFWRNTEVVTSAILRVGAVNPTPLDQLIASYADCTGIEAGYSYFAPGVPANSRLAFEIYERDGRIIHDLPPVSGNAAGYRVATLLDRLQAVRYRRLREAILKVLAEAVAREHPGAIRIRAVFGIAELPSTTDYLEGRRVSYQMRYVYDFHRHLQNSAPAAR